jgi:hypothetical protein
MSRDSVDYRNLDIDTIRDLELDGAIEPPKFQKMNKKRKFDDGTVPTKTGRKKEKVQRGGKDELPEESDDE